MRDNYNTIYKLVAVLRYLWVRLRLGRKLKSSVMGMVGRKCYFHVSKGGGLGFEGRAILCDYAELLSLGDLRIGENLYMNRYSRIICHESIRLGRNVTIAPFVTILDHDHSYELVEDELRLDGYTTMPVIVGNHVWIGEKSTILKGVKIGNNVVVGANSLVNSDLPSNCIAAGNPAKVLRMLETA